MTITIMSVDDHPIFLEGVASVIANAPDFRLVAEATSGRQALAEYRRVRPDVTLMDIRMPDMNGIDAITAIRAEFPHACIVVLTTFEGDTHALRAMKAGAAGYMLKSMVRKDMLSIVRSVFEGHRHIPPCVAEAMATHIPADALSPREIEVLAQAAIGNSNRRIGSELNISEETVKVHMKNLMAKLQANDRTHAVIMALARGIIDVPMRSTT
ncbi:response regulator [Duganella rivi]|uniref:response regulator n=1 Tax=Duganella rivi TaxID=2666083 RepID=UPI001E45175A|nr:response regulator transcription factor [Duganella rivi]